MSFFLKSQIHTQHNLPNQGNKADYMKPTGFPLLIQGVKTNTRDPDAHVLFFDTEALIGELIWLCIIYLILLGI